MRRGLQRELCVGAVSACLMLPQAVVLSGLAGMPPEHGVYASVLPAMIASLCGRNPLILTGPNTAIALVAGTTAVSIAAPAGPSYVALMLLLCFLVGLVQIGLSLTNTASLLRLLPDSALPGVMSGVGLTIVLSQLSPLVGNQYLYDDPTWLNAVRCVLEFDNWNPGALLCASTTLLVTTWCARGAARITAMPLGIAGGALTACFWEVAGGEPLDMLGYLEVSLLAPSLPRWSSDYLPYSWQIITTVFSIALLGLLQTALIARSLPHRHLARQDLRREFRAQGLANLSAALVSAMPVSASFNRSAAHADAGADSVVSAFAAALILLLLACYARDVLSHLPSPVTAAVLMQIGWRLIDKRVLVASCRRVDGAGKRFLVIIAVGVGVSITASVLVATIWSIAAYLRHRLRPAVRREPGATDADMTVIFEGDLFFGTLDRLEQALPMAAQRGAGARLVLHTEYIDADGQALLDRLCRQWRDAGGVLEIVVLAPVAGAALQSRPGPPVPDHQQADVPDPTGKSGARITVLSAVRRAARPPRWS